MRQLWGPHVASCKGCPAHKKQAFRQHVVDSQRSYALHLHQKSVPAQPQDKTFTFSAEQHVKFLANMAIQVSQSQVCYVTPSPQDAIDKKSSLCCRVSEAAKNHLSVDIRIRIGISLFDALSQLRLPVPSASEPKISLAKSEIPSNSTHPPKSSNHQPSSKHSDPFP